MYNAAFFIKIYTVAGCDHTHIIEIFMSANLNSVSKKRKSSSISSVAAETQTDQESKTVAAISPSLENACKTCGNPSSARF